MNYLAFFGMVILIITAYFAGHLVAQPNKPSSSIPHLMCIVMMVIGVAMTLTGLHT